MKRERYVYVRCTVFRTDQVSSIPAEGYGYFVDLEERFDPFASVYKGWSDFEVDVDPSEHATSKLKRIA